MDDTQVTRIPADGICPIHCWPGSYPHPRLRLCCHHSHTVKPTYTVTSPWPMLCTDPKHRVRFNPSGRQALSLNSPWPFAQAPNSPVKIALQVENEPPLAVLQIPNLALLLQLTENPLWFPRIFTTSIQRHKETDGRSRWERPPSGKAVDAGRSPRQHPTSPPHFTARPRAVNRSLAQKHTASQQQTQNQKPGLPSVLCSLCYPVLPS